MTAVFLNQNHPTLLYAGRELCKYLEKLTGGVFGLFTNSPPEQTPVIRLEVSPQRFSLDDPQLDDAVTIALNQGTGVIAGSNPRAVLLGVYRALRGLGCRFLRPGTDGEVLPKLTLQQVTLSLTETASFRHRGAVIEGADSLENILQFIEWLPKAGYNSFFTQFMSISCFLKRWYAHDSNPYLEAEPFDDERCRRYEEQVWDAIALRSILHHAVGHGWTCEPLGIEGRDWEAVELDISPENRELLAMIDGQRDLFHKVPSETNLCYSNPAAREKICDYAVAYLKAHPGVGYLHLWLADSPHSFCECEHCREKTPSDWYLLLLNELDSRLTQEGIGTKIVFLLYYDLLFPPVEQHLQNKDRFVLMFAPISRPFSQSFADFEAAGAPAPYQLNQSPVPRSIEENLGCLKSWQETLAKGAFCPDSFDFDYYMGRAHYGDPGYCAIAKIIDRDIDHLSQLGLNGILSCQELRAAYPTGLPGYLLGLKLWDSSRGYDDIAEEYFSAAFGQQGAEIRALLEKVSDCFDIDFWFRGKADSRPELAARMEKALPLGQEIKDLAESIQPQNDCEQTSYKQMRLYEPYLTLYTKAMICCAQGDPQAGKVFWDEFMRFLWSHENAIQPAMDVFRIGYIARYTLFPEANP